MVDITKGNVRRSVLILALPVVARMFLQMLVGVIDLAMVGSLSHEAISAVGMGTQVFFLSASILNAFTVGTTALIARMAGARKIEEAKIYARQSLVVTLLVGLAIGSVVSFGAEYIMRFMMIASDNPDPEIIRLGTIYLRIVGVGEPLTFVMVTCYAILGGAGNMKAPLYIMASANLLNLVFDYLLIFGIGFFPAWGVAGAAVATAGSQNLAAILGIIYLFSRHSPIRLSLKENFRLHGERIKEIMNIGLPSAGEQLVRNSGTFVFSMLVAGMGPIAIAANQIISKAMSISFQPGVGFGLASTTLIGQNLGAQQPERAEQSGYEACKMAAIFMSTVGLCFFFFSHQIAGFFTSDPAVIKAVGDNLKIMAISQPFMAYVMAMAGALRGAGDTKFVMMVTIIGTWGNRILVAWFLGVFLGLGLRGVWIAMLIDNLTRAAAMIIRYRAGGWKTIKIKTVSGTT